MKVFAAYSAGFWMFRGSRGLAPGKKSRERALLPPPYPAAPGFQPSPARRRGGVTLVELMIALALITIGIIAMVNSFGFIQKAIQASKNKTLASNLAQEKMQIIKQKVYYQVLVTSDPAHNTTDFSPESIDYDTGYFPPENITEAGVTYTRYTLIQVARENSGQIEKLSPSTPDTGMRLINITVMWSQGGVKRKLALRSLMANPDTVMSNAVFNGTVKDNASPTPAAIPGALVNIAENMGWRDMADGAGIYSINASPGNFTMVASADGYYTQMRSVSITALATQTQNFNLVKIATGSISGTVWLRDHLVISQVVASTVQTAGGFDTQYIELFNPTLAPVDIGASIASHSIKLNILSTCGTPRNCGDVNLVYVSTYVVPGGYYLIANSASFIVSGVNYNANAYYSDVAVNSPACSVSPPASDWNPPAVKRLVQPAHNGVVWLTDADGNTIDSVGWNHSATNPSTCETNCVPLAGQGLLSGDQIVRFYAPCLAGNTYGRAYDSNNNQADFYYNATASPVGLPYSPFAGTVQTVIAGTPAPGAVVTASDGVSSSTEAWLAGGACAYSTFTLVNVATGTWTVLISSGQYMLQNNAVLVTTGAVYNFPSSTTFLTQPATMGIITGRVLNSLGAPISVPSAISVSPGGAGSPGNASTVDGKYRLLVSSGMVDVIANPGNGNGSYVSISSLSIGTEIGVVHSGVDFILYQGGRVSGFITRDGINALPGVAVSITDSNGISRDQQISGTDGRFTSISVSTGIYGVAPALGSLEQAIPSSATVSLVTSGATKFSSTFTITGAMGYITGSVTYGGQPIKTGVLIVVTTSTLPGSPPVPPALNAATLAGSPYYIVSSMEDGTYSVAARQATAPKYNVYAYYPTPSGSVATLISSSTANIQVLSGQTTPGVNFSW